MVSRVETAMVKLWGHDVGALAWLPEREYAMFEYEPSFLKRGLDIAPLHMSLQQAQRGDGIFSFPSLNKDTFLGLPGMLADALPDKFGNLVIDAWLARNGRDRFSFSPVERLCYSGQRGMGALEFEPAVNKAFNTSVPLEISELVALAQHITQEKNNLQVEVGKSEQQNREALNDILRVGTSAGGARAKAVIAINDQGEVRSGQVQAPPGFDYWILKFDGVTDAELGEPQSFGRIEYAYYLMALAAGIHMSPCVLLEENGRAHFMTKRFDRVAGEKIHMQTLCGLAHFDYNQAGAYSYEQAFQVMRQLRLSKLDAAQLFRRLVFNVVARNLDDHTKNISFLMANNGQWRLSPAYDMTYAHNPAGQWTNQHQMSINGKRDHITTADLLSIADSIRLKKAQTMIDEIQHAIQNWHEFAHEAGINQLLIRNIEKNFQYI